MKNPLWNTCLTLLFLTDLVKGKSEEWYHECAGGECGYGGKGSATCNDSHEGCRNFALRGECKANPVWMHEKCQKSCGLCVAEHEEDSCTDLHSSCPEWAESSECFTNPGYMGRACPKSCWLCVDEAELRKDDLEEEEIQRRIRFSQTDFGLWQKIPQHEDAKVRQELKNMGKYMKELETTGPGTLCNNLHHECALWTIEKGCEQDLEFMLPHCSLACQYCDIIEMFHDCRVTQKSTGKPFGVLNSIFLNLFHEKKAENLLEGYLEDRKTGEWVLSLPKSAVWKNAEEESQKLLDLLKSETTNGLEWMEASAENFTDSSSETPPARSGRSAVCSSECRKSHPAMETLLSTIASLLQVDTSYLQSLEFVHYKRGERFATHHDFRSHDQWKHSGSRVMTVFLSLQTPEKGGGFGFPDLNWLLVEKPQLLVWPNVGGNPNLPLERVKSEQLPVVEGELYGVYTWVRQYPYDESNPCA